MRGLLTQQLKERQQGLDNAQANLQKLNEGFPEYGTVAQNEAEFIRLAADRPRIKGALCAAGALAAVMGICVMIYGLIMPGALLTAAGAAAVICAVVFKTKVQIPPQLGMTHKELCSALKKIQLLKGRICAVPRRIPKCPSRAEKRSEPSSGNVQKSALKYRKNIIYPTPKIFIGAQKCRRKAKPCAKVLKHCKAKSGSCWQAKAKASLKRCPCQVRPTA